MQPEGQPIQSDSARWYAVRTLPRMEATAVANLRHQDVGVFLPRIQVTRRHARRFETRREPLFPRYAFVRLDLAHARWRSVNGTRGVDGLVMSGDRPAPAPHGVVEAIRAVADADGLVDFKGDLEAGRSVRLIAGPFAGSLGTVSRLDERGRVELLLDMLHGAVRMRVARDMLARVD